MIVKRKPLNLFERLYLPASSAGSRSRRHFFKKKVTGQYAAKRNGILSGSAVAVGKVIAARRIS
jgi:hypothetical protein